LVADWLDSVKNANALFGEPDPVPLKLQPKRKFASLGAVIDGSTGEIGHGQRNVLLAGAVLYRKDGSRGLDSING
jgi:hypothetical protein